MRRESPFRAWFLGAALCALTIPAASLPARALAHEQRDVGAYRFTVGWIGEPAYEGQKNGVDLRVVRDGQPVEGLEQTLQVEITHVDSGASRTQPLRTIFRDPGHYTADILPTSPGVYRMRFLGTIEGTRVDEAFESGPGRYGNIEPSEDLQFPVRLVEGRELQSGVTGARDAAEEAQSTASNARALAIAGFAVGLMGLVLAGASLRRRGAAR